MKNLNGMIKEKDFNSYLGIALAICGIYGSLTNSKKDDTKDNTKHDTSTMIVSIGTVALTAVRLVKKELGMSKEYDILRQKFDEKNKMIDDLIFHDQVSIGVEEETKELIEKEIIDIKKEEFKLDNKEDVFDIGSDLAAAILSSVYVSSKLKINEKGKIDGKSLAGALFSLKSTTAITGNLIDSIETIQASKQDKLNYEDLSKKVEDILQQMKEKVYPLEGANKHFDLLEIKDFNGVFYPKTNYETDEVEYGAKLKISEFSIKRGDVVLLSGASGTGKSTFLRLLKRGDINNRKSIKLDGENEVDYLGREYISYKPSINLGNNQSVLMELTGKRRISDLNEDEKEKLNKVMSELKLDFSDLLQILATKRFSEFSTGQQKRLALSKLLYKVNDETSIIIVDEPVGNVEDSLIREQLKILVEYAKQQNVMLLLTTHRTDLVQDLINKRYHINDNGEMLELSKEIER